MKAALITEEQFKTIKDALESASPKFRSVNYFKLEQALDIIQALKVQEPIAYGHWKSPAWSEEPASLNTSVEKPYGFRADIANWMPLYAGE